MRNLIFALFFLTFSMNAFAEKPKGSQTGRAEFIATMFSKYINNKSVAALYSDLSKALPKDELAFLRPQLSKNYSRMTSTINGSEVFVNNDFRIKFRDDGSLSVKGKYFAYDESKSFEENFKIANGIFGSQSSLYNLFIPRADAFFEAVTTLFTIVVAGAAVAVGAVVLIGNEVYQEIKDGSVVCDRNSFVFRSKKRNAIKWASTDKVTLSPEHASNILNEKVEKCTAESAKKLGSLIVKNLETQNKKAEQDLEKAKRNKDAIKDTTQEVKKMGVQ